MAETKKYLVKFLPDDRSIKVPSGYNLHQAILDSGLKVDSSCGAVGTCGRCKVKIIKGIIKKDQRMIVLFDVLEMISGEKFTELA